MGSFEEDFLATRSIPQSVAKGLRLLGEYKGKQEILSQQSPELLADLRQNAIIESTVASNRLEGITAPEDRIRGLVEERTEPRNRSEQEIAGYREVLNTIHANAAGMTVSTGLVLQLHRDLYGFIPGFGGQWKATDNLITEVLPDGRRTIRFTPVPAFQTEDAMRRLHEGMDREVQLARVEPLLLISAYVLDFLCIHPFLDGNGRMGRLLTLLLLYQAGFEVGRFISLEGQVERVRDNYYEALQASSQGWHQSEHGLGPWWEFFINLMLVPAYERFEQRVGRIDSARGGKKRRVKDAVGRLPQEFTYADVARACPDISRPTIMRAFKELREAGEIELLQRGRDARWRRSSSF